MMTKSNLTMVASSISALVAMVGMAASANAEVLSASDTDGDATLTLNIEDTLVAGVTQLWGNLRIVVDEGSNVFTAGDSIELWLYEDDGALLNDLLWQSVFTISAEELSAGLVDRTIDLSFMAPVSDPGDGLEIFAEALVDKDSCGAFCFADNPVTPIIQVALVPVPDTDNDGVHDDSDTCTLIANPLQRDTDGDGIGNFCDPDVSIPNDCTINFLDLNIYKASFFAAGDLDTDNNGDGQTNFADLNIMKAFFFGPPGPSATGCN